MSGILSMIAGGTYSSAPINTVAPVVSGTATRGQTLSSTTGTWTGKPDPTFAYQWQRAGSNIGSATSSTYTLVSDDVGNAIRCVVTATNVVAAVSANSNATAAVAGVVPGAPTIGTATSTGQTTATVAFTAPADNGGLTITTYTATSSPGSITGTLSQSGSGTITVSGLSSGTSYTFTVTATNSAGTSAASAASNSITTTTSYQLWSWGSNNEGQGGRNFVTTGPPHFGTSSPAQVGALTNWLTLSASGYTTAATKTDGTLWMWGRNGDGQLGGGNTTYRSSPTQVGALTNWLKVSTYTTKTIAIKTDGTLWSWGSAAGGELGLNTTTVSRSSPVQVGSDTDWYEAKIGQRGAVAIKTNGTLWGWGNNQFGNIGDDTNVSKSSPVQVGSDTNWASLTNGQSQAIHVIALKTNGTMWAWGHNYDGVLGLNIATAVNRSSPVQIGALSTWSKISSGSYNSLALKTDGTLWSWGGASSGELGLNDTAGGARSSPTQVGALTHWTQIHCQTQGFGALDNTYRLWTVGRNYVGQLGLNSTYYVNVSSPTQVGSDTTWRVLATSANAHALKVS